MSAVSTTQGRKSRGTAFLASLVFHLLLLAALVAGLKKILPPAAAPPLQVELYSSVFSIRERQPTAHSRPDSQVSQPVVPNALPAPVPEAPKPQGPIYRPRMPGALQDPLAEVTPFYRNHIQDCGKEDLALMPPDQRERCQVRITAQDVLDNGNMQASDRLAKPILRLDPERRAEFDREIRGRRNRAANNDPIKPCDGPTVGLGSACLNHDKPE